MCILAEVLITLGIIGVVAAITLPILVQNYQKKVTVERLKQTYSILSQAIKMSEIDNGPVEEWDLNSTSPHKEFGEKYFKPYLKNIKECNTLRSCLSENYYMLDNTVRNRTHTYSLILSNGTAISILPRSDYQVVQIGVDLNAKKLQICLEKIVLQ